MASSPFIVKFIHYVFESRASHAVMTSTIAAVSKYHIPDKVLIVNVGRHPMVNTAKKVSGNKDLHSQSIVALMT